MKKLILILALFFASFLNSQALLSDSLIGSIPVQEFIDEDIPGAIYDVDVYKIVYSTLTPQGETTIASGLLSIPQVSCDLPAFVYCHGTVFLKSDVPSNFNPEGWLGAAAASNGYVSILPDYLGLGDSPGLHPYVHAESQAEASFHMIRAAEEFCANNNVNLNGQLFLTGYSQGGHASMGLLKYIEEYAPDDFTMNTLAAVCGSGPYDISGEQANMVLDNVPYPTGSYLPYVLLSYQSVYGNLYNDISEIFESPFDMDIPPLFDGLHNAGEIQSFIPAIPSQMLTEMAVEAMQDSMHPINIALRDNDLWNWVPQTPVRMIYCTGDEQVTYLNSLKAEAYMQDNGAPNATALMAGTGDHGDCFEPYILNTLIWFDQLREDCITSLEDPSVLNWDVYPNPTERKLFLSFEGDNADEVNVSIIDLTGQVKYDQVFLSSNALIEIDMHDLVKGIYLLQIQKNDFIETKRIIRN
ncbi:MAG: T9SS type A sorting domain-containing protein [Bacteroidota bacterium]